MVRLVVESSVVQSSLVVAATRLEVACSVAGTSLVDSEIESFAGSVAKLSPSEEAEGHLR